MQRVVGHVCHAVLMTCAVVAGLTGFAGRADAQTAPAGLQYSTFIGGSSEETGTGISVGADGSAYLTGWTGSPDFPHTLGTLSVPWDVFVTRLDPTGANVIYSTILGGSQTDWGYSIKAAPDGSAYVTGFTNSPNFPTTAGAYDRTANGGDDGYVLKLNPAGALVYSTFLGGSGEDISQGIDIDAAGNAYVVGATASTNFPTTAAAYDTSANGSYDATLTKLDPTGSTLLYSTYFGGTNPDYGYGVAVDAAGSAYILGWTSGTPAFPSNVPTTPAAYDRSFNGSVDAFIAKFDVTGSSLVYSTFLGGSAAEERQYGIAVDAAGSAYVTGDTGSHDFPTTPGAYDRTYNGGDFDVFVTKLDPSGASLAYSTFVGGSGAEHGYGLALDGAGNAYVTGSTDSADFPTTAGAYDTSQNGGNDVYVIKLNATGSSLLYSTFVGTPDFELGRGIATDGEGMAYVIGTTNSGAFPTTPAAFDTTANGSTEVFAFKLNPVALVLDSDGDGVPDDVDNCPGTPNSDQADADGDGVGDACDNCRTIVNADQRDDDGNGIGNVCEPVLFTPARVDLTPTDSVGTVSTTYTVTARVTSLPGLPLPGITVRFSVTGSVTRTGVCTTDGTGTCSFTYTGPALPGADAIAAYADTNGDGTLTAGEPVGEASRAWTTPATTAGQVTGGGQVADAQQRDGVAFGFNAKSDQNGVKGQGTLADRLNDVTLKLIDVTSIVQEGNHVTFFGSGTINGQPMTYRVDADDLGEPGKGRDTFGVQTSTGYVVGGIITQGNIQIHK